jgi:hypothetical protein
MQVSFVVSVSLHAAILVAAIVGLPAPEEYEVKVSESIPVEILSVSDLTKLQAQKKDAKPTETPAPKAEVEPEKPAPKPAPKQEQVAALPPAPAEPAPQEPAPEPKPEAVAPAPPAVKRETAKAEDKPEPEPKPKEPEAKPEEKVAKPVPKPRIKPKPPAQQTKNKFDADKIAALLNKLPDKNQLRTDPNPSPDPSPTLGALDLNQGSDDTVTLDEKDALRQQIERCWVPPTGVQGADDLLIRLRIRLKPDGSLQTPPELMNSGNNPYFQVAAESAMRAVRRCEPYSMPPEKYGAWREIILNFDPSQMFRG